MNVVMRFLLALAALISLAQPARAFDQSYWVWQRTAPLTPDESHDLHAANITRLYWHVGTIKWDGTAWRWGEHLRLDWPTLRASCPGTTLIPVIRIEAGKDATFPPSSRAPLIEILNSLVIRSGGYALEIDYESPDRLISEYADFLRQLKDQGRTWRLTISALGHWSRFAGELAPGADEITPMFYDLDPRLERLDPQGLPPLVEPGIADQLAAWRGCPIPWRAGLPNFSRVTVVGLDGKNRGNLRGWSWDEIFFAPQVEPNGPTANGQSLFTVTRDFLLGPTPVHAQEHLAVRYPDRGQLQQAQAASAAAGAQGIVFFRLADSADPSGYTVRDLAATPAAPALQVTQDAEGRYVLTNRGAADLMPIAHGYALELEAATPLWREEIAGDFAQVTTGDNAASTGLGAAHLEFWFTHLPAGHSLSTGYIGTAAQAGAAPVHWRIRNLEEENAWHPLD
jgi:hypothetical protein